MDRLFLALLVREIAPGLVGRRAHGVRRWGDKGLAIALRGKPRVDLVISLSAEAPGFYLGAPPEAALEEKPLPRFRKLLAGAELISVEADPLDRLVGFHWRRGKPSGAWERLDLLVEWAGTRSGVYLVDPAEEVVLDRFSSGPPRSLAGDRFHRLEPPPGAAPLASGAADFLERLERAREAGLPEQVALGAASGLTPLLVDEMELLQSRKDLSLVEAFQELSARLRSDPKPVLLRRSRKGPAERGPIDRLSPISLIPRAGWTETTFASFNEAASAFVRESQSLSEESRIYREMSRALRQRLTKRRALAGRLEEELATLADPADLRRSGELILAGLRQAAPVEGGVELPDPYHPENRKVRVPTDPRLNLPENAQRYFHLSRKAGKARESLKARQARLKAELDHLETLELGLGDFGGGEDLQALAEEFREAGLLGRASEARPRKACSPARLGPRCFRSSRGNQILVGRSARSNDELTFRMAGSGELWFHAAGAAGAHVLLRVAPGREASPEEIEEAAAAAAFFSKARGSTAAEVLYTLRKFVGKIPGAPPGTVRLARFRSTRVRPALPPGFEGDPGTLWSE